MNSKNLLQRTMGLILVVLSLTGCAGAQAGATATSALPTATPMPPTATPTPTPVPPTPTETPTPIQGIDIPLSIQGIELQISSVTQQNSYQTSAGQTLEPVSAEDIFLIIESTVFSDDLDAIHDWSVSTTDDKGHEVTPGLSITTRSGSGQDSQVTWLFVVARASRSFTLHLPDEQTISLDSLLGK